MSTSRSRTIHSTTFFFEAAQLPEMEDLESSFVLGLTELQAHRTESGAGLVFFLEQNLPAFEEPIAQEVLSLAELVTGQPINADFSQTRLESDPVADQSAEMETPVAIQDEEPDLASSRQQTLF